MIRTLAASLVVASLLIFPASIAQAAVSTSIDESGIGIRLLDVPASSQDDARARSYIIDHVAPDATIKRRIQVQNNTASEQAVRVYAGAAQIINDTFVGADGAAANELTTWITTDKDTLHMAPQEHAEVLVTIAVPADAAEGEQYAAIWAEVRSETDPSTNIVSASRVGVRVYLSVGAGNGPAADFNIGEIATSRTEDGAPKISTTITNSGGRALDIHGTLTLSDGPGGLSVGPSGFGNVLTIAPGESGELSLVLDKELPAGPWMATIEARSGLVAHRASGWATFGPTSQVAGAITPSWAPAALTGLAGLVAIAIVAVGIARQRQRNAPSGRHAL